MPSNCFLENIMSVQTEEYGVEFNLGQYEFIQSFV